MKNVRKRFARRAFRIASAAILDAPRRQIITASDSPWRAAKMVLERRRKAVKSYLRTPRSLNVGRGQGFRPDSARLVHVLKWCRSRRQSGGRCGLGHGTPSDPRHAAARWTQFWRRGAAQLRFQPLEFRFGGGDLLVSTRGRGRDGSASSSF